MKLHICFLFFAACLFTFADVFASDAPQWGIDFGNNRISNEKNLPVSFNPGKKNPEGDGIIGTSPNVKWVARIGSRSYTPPVIADGKVFLGTNNDAKFDTAIEGDYGIMLCLDEKTGKFLWQCASKKVTEKAHFDTAGIGITSTPVVAGKRVYFINNRGTINSLDIETGKPVWQLDLITTFKVRQHDANNHQVILHGGLIYAGTSNGLDDKHSVMEQPKAPSFVVLDADTGKPLARDDNWLMTNISHGQWCLPALGLVKKPDGSEQWTFYYATGNGIVHSFKPLDKNELLKNAPQDIGEFGKNLPKIKTEWNYDGDSAEIIGAENVKPYKGGRGSAAYVCVPPLVFTDNKLYVLFCTESITGARPYTARMAALNPQQTGKRLLWKSELIDKGALSPQCISDGLVYLGDRNGGFFCFDAETGKTVWKLELKGDHWAGGMIADGKIYVGTNRRAFYVLRAGRTPEILSEIEMPDAVLAGASAANETLFVSCNGFLYAVGK
ncbi:MAG: PQQ-binding-like beta-propeller repeat protein [Planctomycetaceae bacterium]|nr:PQQ-binding-like beta-propeller repeat protein [Planctomycetaceae bacterium]